MTFRSTQTYLEWIKALFDSSLCCANVRGLSVTNFIPDLWRAQTPESVSPEKWAPQTPATPCACTRAQIYQVTCVLLCKSDNNVSLNCFFITQKLFASEKGEIQQNSCIVFFFFCFYQHVVITYTEGQIIPRRHRETTSRRSVVLGQMMA